jgi:hypothetical protein
VFALNRELLALSVANVLEQRRELLDVLFVHQSPDHKISALGRSARNLLRTYRRSARRGADADEGDAALATGRVLGGASSEPLLWLKWEADE